MKKFIIAFLVFWATAATAQWQVPNGSIPIGHGPGVIGFSSIAPGTSGNCLTSNGSAWLSANCSTTYAVLSKTANYSVVEADNNKLVALSGNTFFTLTFGNPASYSNGYFITISNKDTTRAKYIGITGGTNFLLEPTTTARVWNFNGFWVVDKPALWKLSIPTTLYWDPVGGADVGNDGLDPTSPYLTLEALVLRAASGFNLNTQQITFKMVPAGSTDTVSAHIPIHSVVGAQGGAAMLIDGNGGTISAAGTCWQFYFAGSSFQIRRIKFSCVTGIEEQWGPRIELLDGVEFADTVTDIALGAGSKFYFGQNYNISGPNRAFHITNNDSILVATSVVTPFILNNITFSSAFVQGQGPGTTSLANAAYNLGGHVVTGLSYRFFDNHAGYGGVNIPGSAGVTSGAGTFDGAFKTPLPVAEGGTGSSTNTTWTAIETVNATYNLATASGTQDITGFGFNPKSVVINMAINTGSMGGIGYASSSGAQGGSFTATDSGTTWARQVGSALFVSNAAQTVYQLGSVSFITDGIRITWTKAGAPAGTLGMTVQGQR